MRAEEQRTDRRIAEKAAKEQWEASAGCRERVERILAELPDTSEQEETGMRKIWSRRTLILAAALAAGCVAQFLEWAIVDGNAFAVDSRGTKVKAIHFGLVTVCIHN